MPCASMPRCFNSALPPRRIDLWTSISGVSFDEAWRTRAEAEFGNLRVPFLGRDALLKNKRASGRPKDLVDLAVLAHGLQAGRELGRQQRLGFGSAAGVRMPPGDRP